MEKNKNVSIGLSYGVLIGIFYVIVLFARWSFGTNFIVFGSIAFIGYLLIIGLLFFEAYQRKKLETKRVIDLKNLFQTLFISVLIFELIYAIYNYVHLAIVDPDVIDRMKVGMQQMFDKMPEGQMSDEQKENSLKQIDEMKKATEFEQIVKSYLISISVSGFIAFLVALIMRKKDSGTEMPQHI